MIPNGGFGRVAEFIHDPRTLMGGVGCALL